MEDVGTSEEEDNVSQDSNVFLDHGHLARYCAELSLLTSLERLLAIQMSF